MREIIYCKTTAKGVHTFYLCTGGEELFLFNQAYRKGVGKYYKNGVSLKDAMNYSKAQKDSAIIRTMSKIPMYIKYVEKDHGIEVLEKTKRKGTKRRYKHCA